jgi:hypothetical protein
VPKHAARKQQIASRPEILKGMRQIVFFLGEPISVVQRWANEGMPVQRQVRFVATPPKELDDWLGQQSGKPVRVAMETGALTEEAKARTLIRSCVRKENRPHAKA